MKDTNFEKKHEIRRTAMNISRLSGQYRVRRLTEQDVSEVYLLCSRNELYYRYCPPFVSEESVRGDMKALPPKVAPENKYYIGFYDKDALIGVMDLIIGYPDEDTAFIGFFMMDVLVQGKGKGSGIIDEVCTYLKESRIAKVRLGWVDGNPQSAHFWHKNGFSETGETGRTQDYTVVLAERALFENGYCENSGKSE